MIKKQLYFCIIYILLIILINLSNQQNQEPNKALTKEEHIALYNFPAIKTVSELEFNKIIQENERVLVIFFVIEERNFSLKSINVINNLTDNVLQELNVLPVKINAYVYENLFFKYNFRVLPGIVLINKGKDPEVYYGDHNEEDLKLFLRKKLMPHIKKLNSVKEVEEFKSLNSITAVTIGIKLPNDIIKALAKDYNNILFGYCSSEDCLEKYNKSLFNEIKNFKIKNNDIDSKKLNEIYDNLNKNIKNISNFYSSTTMLPEYMDYYPFNYDTKFYVFSIYNKKNNFCDNIYNLDKINDCIEEFSLAPVSMLNDMSLQLISRGKDVMIIFDNNQKEILSLYESIAFKLNNYSLSLLYSDPSQPLHLPLMRQLGITEISLPNAIIVQKSNNRRLFFKYNYDPKSMNPYSTTKDNDDDLFKLEEDVSTIDISAEDRYVRKPMTKYSLLNFANDWKYNQLNRFPDSEPIPVYNIPEASKEFTNVVKLVGHNFLEVANDPTKTVLIKFYSEECKFCQQFAPTYEELARILKPSKNLIIADIDIEKNTLPLGDISLPFVALFPRIKDSNVMHKTKVLYKQDRNLIDMLFFVGKYGNIDLDFIKEDF